MQKIVIKNRESETKRESERQGGKDYSIIERGGKRER